MLTTENWHLSNLLIYSSILPIDAVFSESILCARHRTGCLGHTWRQWLLPTRSSVWTPALALAMLVCLRLARARKKWTGESCLQRRGGEGRGTAWLPTVGCLGCRCCPDSWKAGSWSLLISTHLEGYSQTSTPAWRGCQVYSHVEDERDVERGRLEGDSSYEGILWGCVWGMGVPEWGNRKAFQGPVYVLLRDTECTWASFPKEYRCLAWPQLDCPATLSLAVFTSRHLKTFSSSSA